MNRLFDLTNLGFNVTWKLIEIGLFGNDNIPILLTMNDVIEFCNDTITEGSTQIDNIIKIICEEDNIDKFNKIIIEFAKQDTSNEKIQVRKWRAYLLKNILDNISKDVLQGLLALIEFWYSVGTIENCPISFPDDNDYSSIRDFFLQDSYENAIDINREWLDKEIANIIDSDGPSWG